MYTTKEDLHKSVRWWWNIRKGNPGEGESYPKDDMWKTELPPNVDARTDPIEKWWGTADTAQDAQTNSWDRGNS